MKAKAFLSLLLICAAVGAHAATGYTNRADFNAAVSSYAVPMSIAYDTHAIGASANFGKMTAYANGLSSDGSTLMGYSLVVTNSFGTTSGSNSVGVDIADHQFLSGNSDAITFYFSGPIHAFGLNLIGDPSPTGSPAIPFWKMGANIGDGFDVYSATSPSSTISAGNDVYFMGVTSTEPFTQVTLYSDNDPAAVFSFNIDDIYYGLNPKLVDISDIKNQPLGTIVMLTDVPVERRHASIMGTRCNVESRKRDAGIVVLGDLDANRTDTATFTGTMTMTSDDELAIALDQCISTGDNGDPVKSLGMCTRSLGGSIAKGLQISVPGSVGPNNIGLDVTIWGKITAKSSDANPYAGGPWIIVDDGAGRVSGEGDAKGVKVTGAINVTNRSVGDFVVVHGSCSMWKSQDGTHYPLVRVAAEEDVTP